MLEIPESQRPISGTEGAQRRREQLERQVPPHDLDPTKCHSLTDEEIASLENYRQHLKEGVVGQGRVATLAAMLKDLGISYGAIAQDRTVILGNPQVSKNSAINKNEIGLSKLQCTTAPEASSKDNDNNEFFPPPPSPQTLANLEQPQFPPPLGPPRQEPTGSNFLKRPSAYLPTPYGAPRNFDLGNGNAEEQNQFQPITPVKTQGGGEEMAHQDFKTPSAKSVTFADIQTPANVPEKFTNVPVQAKRFENNNEEGDLPAELAGLQMTDSDDMIEGKCKECHLPAAPGDVVVTAERAGSGAFWHPACFVCCTCKVCDYIFYKIQQETYIFFTKSGTAGGFDLLPQRR